jgi:hypothetical protein
MCGGLQTFLSVRVEVTIQGLHGTGQVSDATYVGISMHLGDALNLIKVDG